MKSWTYVEPRSGGGRAWEGIFARDDGGDLLGSEIDLRNFFERLPSDDIFWPEKGFKKKVTRNFQKSAKKSSLVVVSKFFLYEFFIPTSSVVGEMIQMG